MTTLTTQFKGKFVDFDLVESTLKRKRTQKSMQLTVLKLIKSMNASESAEKALWGIYYRTLESKGIEHQKIVGISDLVDDFQLEVINA